MTRHRQYFFAIALVLPLALLGCASSKKSKSPNSALNNDQLIQAAMDAAHASMKASKRGVAKAAAERGMEYARQCVAVAPDDPACYYWRAVNTGLYYKVHVIGYQRGVKRMIADCEKVIGLNPGYDHAGAYRILGEIYTRLPETGGAADSVVRDLPKAESYLRKAVGIAKDYPENHVALAATLYAEDKNEESAAALQDAKRLAPQWRHDVSYADWSAAISALEKKIMKK